ncbi:hypothetical protein J6O48_14015 [bacterium]|nr:hypothetical protein [bacterium]
MQLIFKNKENTGKFTNWLKSFKEIQKSLLIECDLQNKYFVSKGFTTDHTIVRYSKISFADADLEVINIKDDKNTYTLDEWNKTNTERIKIGIFMILPKFIQVIDMFSGTDYTLTVEFNIFKNNDTNEYHAQSLNFKSKTLKMKVKDCNISEFEQLSDTLFFNNINVIDDSMSFEISTETIKNLISISSVFVSDASRDIISFNTKFDETVDKWAIYAYDQTNESYDYLLGYLIDGKNSAENQIPIYRHSFLSAINVKGNDENIIITIPATTNRKMRISSKDENSYTVLSTVRQ